VNLNRLAKDACTHFELAAAKIDSKFHNQTMNVTHEGHLESKEAVLRAVHVPVSWRNHRSAMYGLPQSSSSSRAFKTGLRGAFLLLVMLLTFAPLTVLAAPHTLMGLQRAVTAVGEASFMSNEHILQAKHELQQLKLRPYDGAEIAAQFNHGINSYLPEGVTSKINPERYEKDEECSLVMDRVPGLTNEQFNEMRTMLRDMAADVVAYSMDQITGYSGVEPPMRIDLDTTAPILTPPRRNWSPAEVQVIIEKCTELLASNICVEIPSSMYSCNPVLAMKRAPDGTWSDKRFCVNFIPINKHTELDRYGSHRADELFQKVVKAKYLTALDLRSGFHQIPMHPDSIAKTAFWFVSGTQPPRLLAYRCMPFGLKNASAKFQRVMDAELVRSGCTEFAFAYIDDLLVASDTYEEHVEHVRRILQMLKECNLKIHPDKSVFGTNIVEYLGHNVVGQHGITMNEAKVESIKSLPTPTNVPELRSIIGFLAYYRHFIPGFSSITAPMNELLKKDVPWEWGPRQASAYATLKRLMTKPDLVLRPIDPNRPLVLHTDWCVHGIGAVLGQLDDDGHEYLCACISRSLNKHEKNYPSYKGELLALAWAVRMFRHHLHGTSFKLVTDHQPLLWIMKARDLNGQYARWQLLLQEYDFDIVHRAGVKHTNADVLSRFPMQTVKDNSGARFDGDEERVTLLMARAAAAARKPPPIDSFAPRFCDLFSKGVTHVDENTYMQSVLRDPTPDELDPVAAQNRQRLENEIHNVVAALKQLPGSHFDKAVAKARREPFFDAQPPYGAGLRSHAIDTSIVGPHFFKEAKAKGISLVELCAGLATGLTALLQTGVTVNKYYYVDKDPVARAVAKYRLAELSAKYPIQFPITAWVTAFDLPQDVAKLNHQNLGEVIDRYGNDQFLVVAGWPCQEYSPAGHGNVGARAGLLEDVLRVIRWLQRECRGSPPAYILENVAMQNNFRYEHIRYPVFMELLSRIGDPITFDAVQVGSRAHRLRNYWTNLVEASRANAAMSFVRCPPTEPLTEILGPGREPAPVLDSESSHSGIQVNEPGKPRRAFPTFTAYPLSRAFRAGKPGSIYDTNTDQWTEPNAEEREAAMGYDVGATEAPGVTNSERRRLLGQAMDVHSIIGLWAVSQSLCKHHLACDPTALHPRLAALSNPKLVNVCTCPEHHESCYSDPLAMPIILNQQSEDINDIWNDQACMDFLQQGFTPQSSAELNRVRKRARWYRWHQDSLHRFVKDRRSNTLSLRKVPHPNKRGDVIMNLHASLGHIGEKRTIHAITQIYWWHGMTVDVRRYLSTCKLCHRVGVNPPHQIQDMQTESHDDYGLFYRWGIDYLGELPPSAAGNRYALIFIDYYSKWVEVIPVPRNDAATTVRHVLLNLVARYGVPGEIICDNGPSFKGDFEAFCKEKLIDLHFITPGMPRSNGLAERMVKTVKYALQKYASFSHGANNWDTEGLANILLGYRCTKQAATQLSPAQILFAQDPAVHADKWVSQKGAMDFLDTHACAEQLLVRSKIARELRIQVAENLRLAHARNVARFKALRSGLYQPKINHFELGDFVFVLSPEDQVPGGALGIPARDEILKVVEIRSSGVLVLENQGGRRFDRHVEQCVPCDLTNIEGTVHPDLIKPSWKFPCTMCGDHRQGSKMLLCDGCNLGFHYFCLPVPLSGVPNDTWLCHTCLAAGITIEQVKERQAKYVPTERSRPRIELPGHARRAHARSLADKWHGVPVKHTTSSSVRFGRVTFTDISNPKWFRIFWNDGTRSDHDARILSRLEVLQEHEAPDDLIVKPPPVVILVTRESPEWSVQTEKDIMRRLSEYMPGYYDMQTVARIHKSLSYKSRKAITVQNDHRLLDMINATMDLRPCRVIFDPWAGNHAVRKGLDTVGNNLVLNDKLGGKHAHLVFEPLESVVYMRVVKAFGRLDAIVMAPPMELVDLAFINALEFASQVVLMLVHESWVRETKRHPRLLLDKLERESRLLILCDENPLVGHVWCCVFASPQDKQRIVRQEADCGGSEVILRRILP
jgi:transposase InsO family protein